MHLLSVERKCCREVRSGGLRLHKVVCHPLLAEVTLDPRWTLGCAPVISCPFTTLTHKAGHVAVVQLGHVLLTVPLLRDTMPWNPVWGSVTASPVWLGNQIWESAVSVTTLLFVFAGERPYQCAMCPYSSSQKTHLTRHMRTHSGWYEWQQWEWGKGGGSRHHSMAALGGDLWRSSGPEPGSRRAT